MELVHSIENYLLYIGTSCTKFLCKFLRMFCEFALKMQAYLTTTKCFDLFNQKTDRKAFIIAVS